MIRFQLPAQLPAAVKINKEGQSLLEITMAIGVVIVIVTALTIVTLNGIRNSQFAQNQSQATKLAQDALEKVRAVRDRDGMVDSSLDSWSSFNWSTNCSDSACNFKIGTKNATGTSCDNSSSTTIPCLIYSASPVTETILGKFTRSITILELPSNNSTEVTEKCQGDQKKVRAAVSWQDASGVHQSYLETILGNLGC